MLAIVCGRCCLKQSAEVVWSESGWQWVVGEVGWGRRGVLVEVGGGGWCEGGWQWVVDGIECCEEVGVTAGDVEGWEE